MASVNIKSAREGFRRAGVAHSREFVSHKDGAFTDEQIEQLLAEPMLTVHVLDDNGEIVRASGQKAAGEKKPAKAK